MFIFHVSFKTDHGSYKTVKISEIYSSTFFFKNVLHAWEMIVTSCNRYTTCKDVHVYGCVSVGLSQCISVHFIHCSDFLSYSVDWSPKLKGCPV